MVVTRSRSQSDWKCLGSSEKTTGNSWRIFKNWRSVVYSSIRCVKFNACFLFYKPCVFNSSSLWWSEEGKRNFFETFYCVRILVINLISVSLHLNFDLFSQVKTSPRFSKRFCTLSLCFNYFICWRFFLSPFHTCPSLSINYNIYLYHTLINAYMLFLLC